MANKALNENPRFFISYASEDRAKVREYEDALLHVGLEVWLDQTSISLSNSIVAKINEGIQESKYALIFYSNFYKSKVWPQEEMAALIFAALSSEGSRKIFVIRLDDSELPPLLAHRLWTDDKTPQQFANRMFHLIKVQDEMADSFPTPAFQSRPENTIEIKDLDNRTCISIANAIVDNGSKLKNSSESLAELSIKSKQRLVCQIWVEALTYDLLADLKSWLKMIQIHSTYINDYHQELAEDALGKFKPGFRLALEQRIVQHDLAQNELRSYLDFVCKKIIPQITA